MKNRRGTQVPPVLQIWCNSDYYLQSHGILKKLARAIFFDHLETVGRTEPVFELNLALRGKRPTNQCRSDPGIFFYRVIMLTSQVATFVPGQSCQRAKNRTDPFPGKIGRGILNLVALALTVTDLFNKVCEKV